MASTSVETSRSPRPVLRTAIAYRGGCGWSGEKLSERKRKGGEVERACQRGDWLMDKLLDGEITAEVKGYGREGRTNQAETFNSLNSYHSIDQGSNDSQLDLTYSGSPSIRSDNRTTQSFLSPSPFGSSILFRFILSSHNSTIPETPSQTLRLVSRLNTRSGRIWEEEEEEEIGRRIKSCRLGYQ